MHVISVKKQQGKMGCNNLWWAFLFFLVISKNQALGLRLHVSKTDVKDFGSGLLKRSSFSVKPDHLL